MARKPNYDFERRKKELDRKAKKDAKREDRARRKREGGGDDTDELTTLPEDGDATQPDATQPDATQPTE